MKKLREAAENIFETLLFNTRFAVFIAVICSAVSMLVLFILGGIKVYNAVTIFLEQLEHSGIHEFETSEIISSIISSVDTFLFATVLLIFSMGIYELFISEIDPASRKEDSRPAWLQVDSIDDLKSSLGKVILLILIVTLFEHSFEFEVKNNMDLLIFAAVVLFVALALLLMHKLHDHKPKHRENKEEK